MKKLILITIILSMWSCDNSTEPVSKDCAGVEGGSAYLDGCAVCDANTTNDCLTDGHSFNSSTLQAFYLFSLVTLDGIPIASTDWVIAVNNGVVVGSSQWDTSNCGGGICSVPVMGDDGSDDTDGYMQTGDIPLFIIYDTSSDTYYHATSSPPVDPWSNLAMSLYDLLEVFSE